MKNNRSQHSVISIVVLMLIIFVLPNISYGQKLNKAYSTLKKGDTTAAFKAFKKGLKKHKDPFAAYYGMGLCQMNTKPKDAFINFKKVDAKFRNSAKDFRKFMFNTYGITPDSVKDKMNIIAATQFRRILLYDSTENAFSAFIRTYKGCNPSFIKKAERMQEEAAYREAKKDNTLKKAKRFTYNYPHSNRIPYIEEYIDSVEYFSKLVGGNRTTLYRYKNDYEKGKLFSLRANYKNSRKQTYYGQAKELYSYLLPNETLSDGFINEWIKNVYYSGHWTRLNFFYNRLPHLMNDSLKRMYYAGIYAEKTFAEMDVLTYYGKIDEDYLKKRDSIYDFYIVRGAPSMLALRKMQDIYKYDLANGDLNATLKVINHYAPLFPNFKGEIEALKKLITENKDSCKKVKLPDFINTPPVIKPQIKYVDVKGKKIPYMVTPDHYENHYNLLDASNKYPVISPDGKKLYFTHWEYEPIKFKMSTTYKHMITDSSVVVHDEYLYKKQLAVGICYSENKNGKWQPIIQCKNLYKRDSLRIDTITKIDTVTFQWVRNKEVIDKFIKKGVYPQNVRKDRILRICIYNQLIPKDSARYLMGGISNDNNTMFVITPEKMRVGKSKIYRKAKVIDITANVDGDWQNPRVCGNVNQYVESDPDFMPNPFFGSVNPHPSPKNNTSLFGEG